MPELTEIMDSREAAEYCGLPWHTFRHRAYRMGDRSWSPSGHLGTKPYWTKTDLDRYLAEWRDRRFREHKQKGKE